MTDPEHAVPLLDLKAQYATIREEVESAIGSVLKRQDFVLGADVAALEQELAEYCEAPHAVSCASGSDAILLALMALDVGPGDEVICPSYTFFSTASSVARLGAVPVFADIDPVTYNMDPGSARAAAARCRRLKAIMPVHLFGQVAATGALQRLADEHGVPLIEDAAQALGSRDERGRPAGALGLIGCISFYPSKNLGGFGDGGMLTTRDAALAHRLSVLRVHGAEPKYHHHLLGINSRLDTIQAAVLRVKLRRLDAWHEARRANARWYDQAFADAGAATSASPPDGGTLPLRTPAPAASGARHIYNQYVVRVPAALRDPLREHLRGRNIGTEVYYPVPLHRQACFGYLGEPAVDLGATESAAQETLALPIYPELRPAQREHVAEAVIGFLRDAGARRAAGAAQRVTAG